MRYDMHTHIFRRAVAPRAMGFLQKNFGLAPAGTGTLDDALTRMHKAGIERFAAHTAALTPDQVIPANNWTLELSRICPQCIPFGAMHPGYAKWEQELDRLSAHGVRGLKFHPDLQHIALTDPCLDPLFEAATGRFSIMVHVGSDQPQHTALSNPKMFMDVHRRFPGLTLIAAHLGGFKQWAQATQELAGENVFVDTSSILNWIDTPTLEQFFRKHPREKILFGSDYPFFDPALEARRLTKRLHLTTAEMDELFSNAMVLFPQSIS